MQKIELMNKIKVYGEVLFATIVWGAAYPFTKHVVALISPLSLVFLRCLFASILMLVFVRINFKKYLRLDLILKLVVMSVIGISVQQFSQCYALKYTASTNAGFIIALTPIIIVLIELFWGEKISINKIIAFVSGLLGCLAVMYSLGRFSLSLPSTKGDLVFLTSSFTWAFYVVLTKRWFKGYSQNEVTAITMIMALITLIPFEFKYSLVSEIKNLDMLGYISLAYLCLFSSFLGYLFWNDAVNKLGAVKSSYFIYDEPFATIISAYLLLGEKVMPLTLVGGVLILIGVYFVLKVENRKALEYG
jgi:drug/metabolite transporter (DMT)-like permease